MDAGYWVFEACEAADALAILEDRDDIRAVFTDIEMLGMTELVLAAEIHKRWPQFAITSGRPRPEPDALPARAGFIAKPTKPRRWPISSPGCSAAKPELARCSAAE